MIPRWLRLLVCRTRGHVVRLNRDASGRVTFVYCGRCREILEWLD